MLEWLRSDAGVYTVSGLFAVLVFVVAVALVIETGTATPGDPAFSGFLVGFGAFVAVYFISLGIWHAVSE